jgi:5-methylcytosine-specific restriction endonuclease McrA
MLEGGEYLFLGLDYPYNSAIFHNSSEGVFKQVGICINGIRVLNKEFLQLVGYTEPRTKNSVSSTKLDNRIRHKTSRDIGDGLRYKVFKRDNYKCCFCGASPAKDPSIVLHADHVIPWSKGGETVLDNLQTLCSRCNIGKSADM